MTQVIQLSSGIKCKLTVALFVMLSAILLPAAARAQDTTPKDTKQSSPPATLSSDDELTQLRKDVQRLSGEVGRLKAEVAKLERYKTIDYTRELMIKEEQRVRDLQRELIDDAAKETAAQKRLDEIEEEQRPDRIERSLAGVGSTKPEQDREAIATRLSNEKRRIQAQLETLRAARTRIPPLITNAEESITRLKQRLIELRTPH
jgi:peptidoglycan hydrolase CwlO-like protein